MGFFFGRRSRAADLALLEAAHGSTACMAALSYLTAIVDGQLTAQLVKEWPRVEAVLWRAIADCPPDLRPVLADSLQRVHAATDHRATQKGVMDVRRALIAQDQQEST